MIPDTGFCQRLHIFAIVMIEPPGRARKPLIPDRQFPLIRIHCNTVARGLYTASSYTMMSTNKLQLNALKGNTVKCWVECDGMELPIYGVERSVDHRSIVGWIPVEQGKVCTSVLRNAHPLIAPFMQPFVIWWYRVKPATASKHKPCNMTAGGAVDGVRLPYERHMLVAKKFWQSKYKFEGFESDSGKSHREFSFSKLELTGMSVILISYLRAHDTCVNH